MSERLIVVKLDMEHIPTYDNQYLIIDTERKVIDDMGYKSKKAAETAIKASTPTSTSYTI